MNREDIIRMAREAGFQSSKHGIFDAEPEELERFAALVAAAEQKKLRLRLKQCEALALAVMADQISCDCNQRDNRDL